MIAALGRLGAAMAGVVAGPPAQTPTPGRDVVAQLHNIERAGGVSWDVSVECEVIAYLPVSEVWPRSAAAALIVEQQSEIVREAMGASRLALVVSTDSGRLVVAVRASR